MAVKKELGRREFFKVAGLGLLGAAAAACTPQETTTPINPATTEPKTVYRAKDTPVPTATEAPKPTPTLSILTNVEGSGGAIDKKLWDEVSGTEYIRGQQELMMKWIKYWGGANSALMTPDMNGKALDLAFDPTNMPTGKDDPALKEKVNVLLVWNKKLDDDTVVTMRSYFPINAQTGEYQTVPPAPTGAYEVTDYQQTGTLDLTDGTEGNKLVWRKNQWVRANMQTKEVKERIQKVAPFDWEAATLVLDQKNLIQVLDWDGQGMTAERMKELAAKPDIELLAAAPKVDVRFFHSDRPDIVSLTPAEVTKLDGGVTLVRYDTNVAKTVVTKTMQEPGLWWQVEKGTVGKEISPEIIKPLVDQFGVIPEHPYGFSGNQFIDYWNLYVMAEKKDGQWVKPADETRCGHLSPKDENFLAYSAPDADTRIMYTFFVARLSGNARWEKGIPLRDQYAPEVDVLVDDLVFRDYKGKLKVLKTQLRAIDPKYLQATNYLYTIVPKEGSGCESPKTWREAMICYDSEPQMEVNGEVEDNLLSVFNQPGQKVYSTLRYQPGPLYNYDTVTRKVSWAAYKNTYEATQKNRSAFKELSEAMVNPDKEWEIPQGLVLTNSMTHVILTEPEFEMFKEKFKN